MTIEQLGLTPEQGEQLLRAAAKRLGISPEQLAKQIAGGKYDALLSTPQAKQMIKSMNGDKKRGGK